MNGKYIYGLLILAALLPQSASATEEAPSAGELSYNITATSDYRFRGISQTLKDPALQGGFEYAIDNVIVGIWASNVNYGDTGSGNLEVDFYLTYDWVLSDSWSMQAGMEYNKYPGTHTDLNYDYGEVLLSSSYTIDVATITAEFNYTPKNTTDSGNGYYPRLSAALALPHDFVLDGGIGRQWAQNNEAFGYPDYTDWNLGIAYNWQGFTGKLEYIDTNISETACAKECDATAVLSVTKEF
jgi:uncharacterized protein (TIGR02001 family)